MPLVPIKPKHWELMAQRKRHHQAPQTLTVIVLPCLTVEQIITGLAQLVQAGKTPHAPERAKNYAPLDDIFALLDPQSPLPTGPSLTREDLTPLEDASCGRSLSPIPSSSHGFPPAELSVPLIDPESVLSWETLNHPMNQSPPLRHVCPEKGACHGVHSL